MHPYHHMVKGHGKAKLRSLGGKTPHNEHDMDARVKRASGGHAEMKASGYASGGRLDKKGRGGHHTTIVIAPHPGPRPPMASPAATPMPPPGMSGGPMPSPAMQKRGGSVHKKHYAKGGRVHGEEKSTLNRGEQEKFLKRAHGGPAYIEGETGNEKKWAHYASKNSYAKGGGVKKVSDGHVTKPTDVWASKSPSNKKPGKIASLGYKPEYGRGSGMGTLESAKSAKRSYP